MYMEELEKEVYEALDNARENGYDLANETLDFITDDLLAYDADLDGAPRWAVRSIVASYLYDKFNRVESVV